MAQLQSTSITGSFFVGTSPNTATQGNIWYNTTLNRLQYSYLSGGTIICCTL